jgi:hypothetical protein
MNVMACFSGITQYMYFVPFSLILLTAPLVISAKDSEENPSTLLHAFGCPVVIT